MSTKQTRKVATAIWATFCMFAMAMTFSLPAAAQTFTATLTGTVSDPSGGALPNAKVIVTNQGTKLDYTTTTTDAGIYTLPFLPVGAYVISVEASGFKKLVSNELRLEINQTARVNLTMQVGAVSEQVTISDIAPVLQTENTTVGGVISGNTTTALPLNGRNFQQLALLVPGAVTPNPGAFTGPGQAAQGRPYVNGNREQGNSFLLDGVSVDETIDNRIGYKPNVDAIAEFKIETSNSSAEFGNVTGATVNATMKSGTNEFRGNVFEFVRNDAFDANSWANNRSTDPSTGKAPRKRKLRQNIFGGTLGGPIIREKLFFFTDYQGILNRTGGSALRSVAPVAWRNGDLSSISPFIRDPQRPGLCQATPAAPTAGVNYQESCFPGSIIPTTRFSAAARALFADPRLYPLPTGTGVNNNYLTNDANAVEQHQFDVKIDARLTDKDNFSGRYSFADFKSTPTKLALPTDVSTKSTSRPQNIALNWTRTISSTIINEARLGFNRAVFISDLFDVNGLGNGNSKFGIPGTQAGPGLANIRIGNGLTGLGSTGVTEDNVTNTFHYGDNLTILAGRHSFKMGGQWQRYQQNRFYPGNNGLLGYFDYGGARFTNQAFGDFLLDQLNQKGVGNNGGTNPGTWGHRQNRIGLFFQDDFKVRNNLTLNLGMRWEYTSPVIEVNDRQANYDIKTGARLVAGQNGNSRALYRPFRKGFEPRLGFAWTPGAFNNRLVVRAGYGITQYMEGTGSNLRLPLNFPFFIESDTPFDRSSGAGTITRGFTDVTFTNTPSGLIRIWNPDIRPQFTQQWNLTMEYQLDNTTSLSVGYVGHNATHLVAPQDFNQPLPGVGPAADATGRVLWADAQTRRPLFAVLPRVTAASGTDTNSNSNYNGLQVLARKRLANGFEFMGSYTFSKTLTDNIGYYGSGGVAGLVFYQGNQYNRRADYGRAFFDATHNLTVSGSYDLPFGKGRAFGSDWNPAVNAVLGGWNLSNIVSVRSGFPMTIRANDVSQQLPRGGGRPNVVAGQSPLGNLAAALDARTTPVAGGYLNPAAFSLPAIGSFGTSGIGTVEAPGYVNWDFGVGKKFYLTERYFFDFRTEFFNTTNTPSFSPPDVNWSNTNNFGKITGTVSNPRNLEFALKFHF